MRTRRSDRTTTSRGALPPPTRPGSNVHTGTPDRRRRRSQEFTVEIRIASAPNEIARAIAIDEGLTGSASRRGYITSVAEKGGLRVAALHGEIRAFSCVDHGYFFGKPFVSLLVVSADARRCGLGAGLLALHARTYRETWTSTNRSNIAMQKLLEKAGWRYCGELSGLDEGDDELFYRTSLPREVGSS